MKSTRSCSETKYMRCPEGTCSTATVALLQHTIAPAIRSLSRTPTDTKRDTRVGPGPCTAFQQFPKFLSWTLSMPVCLMRYRMVCCPRRQSDENCRQSSKGSVKKSFYGAFYGAFAGQKTINRPLL